MTTQTDHDHLGSNLGRQYADLGHRIGALPLNRRSVGPLWYLGMTISMALLGFGTLSVLQVVTRGIGVWGNNIPVVWAFDIINFVWWIGIGHAGTLISAILLLFRQEWRTSINRFAEAMTLFAVSCAGLFPLLHLGRLWKAYYLFPYPNSMGMWPQFRSPLVWDVFAVSTYATVSALFWYLGLIPDMATLRDQAKRGWAKVVYGMAALGWRGSAEHWNRHQTAYLILAGLATPLVLSVHSVVSFDFAVGIIPGWHTTIFPPYFVAGAVYAGFAMVIILMVPLRHFYHFRDMITDKHFDNMAKVMLLTGLIVAYGYFMEVYIAWYGGNQFENYVTWNRFTGPMAWSYWALILTNVAIPQLLWFRSVRYNRAALFIISLVVSVGMWLERFVIIVVSLSREYLPSSWESYSPTIWDFGVYGFTIGLFLFLTFAFVRILPAISIYEVRELLHHESAHGKGHGVAMVAEQTVEGGVPRRQAEPMHLVEHHVLHAGELYGIMAEFDTPEELIAASNKTREAGYTAIDAFSPFPVEELPRAVGLRRSRLPWFVLGGAIAGGVGGYLLQYWTSVIDYPINVGGRPYHSWPAFLVPTFETTILGASLCAVIGTIIFSRLPTPYHPVFNDPGFARASRDRFFLLIESEDERFDRERTREFMRNLHPIAVREVPA